MIRESQDKKLAEMGRQTTSIRPTDPNSGRHGHPHKNQGHVQDDELFRSYDDIMRNVDNQLRSSRKMFPD